MVPKEMHETGAAVRKSNTVHTTHTCEIYIYG